MKALILAAGLGTRLAPITNDIPKSLVKVNGTPILVNQIQGLLNNGITEITVIAGYKADRLMREISAAYSQIHVIENTIYESTNNMYSAYLGKRELWEDDFVMMNADVFFDESVIKGLLECEHKNSIVTDIGKYNEESMKVVEKDGRLVQISKTISPEQALGTSIDVYKFSSEAGKAFFEKCAEYIEIKKEVKLWSEVALNDVLKEIEFKACPLLGRWMEIDNHDDLAEAERIFG